MSTPKEFPRSVWFTKTEHEMFRDCEREEIVEVIANYIQGRMNTNHQM